MDELPVSHVAYDGPAQLQKLLLCVMLEEFVEELLFDVGVISVKPLGVMESRFFGRGKVGIAPGPDLRDGLLFKGVSFP